MINNEQVSAIVRPNEMFCLYSYEILPKFVIKVPPRFSGWNFLTNTKIQQDCYRTPNHPWDIIWSSAQNYGKIDWQLLLQRDGKIDTSNKKMSAVACKLLRISSEAPQTFATEVKISEHAVCREYLRICEEGCTFLLFVVYVHYLRVFILPFYMAKAIKSIINWNKTEHGFIIFILHHQPNNVQYKLERSFYFPMIFSKNFADKVFLNLHFSDYCPRNSV